MSTHTLAGQPLLQNGTALDTIIGQLLGQGLGYDDWKRELENQGGFAWTESLKNTIIKREFSFFREEILRLQSEPNTARGLKSKTNSLESILKRLQGLEWVKGVPNEMEQRRRDGRLLGKDAKSRCLQYHVSRWKSTAASASQSSSTSTFISEHPESMPITRDTEATSSNRTQISMCPAVNTLAQQDPTIANSPSNDTFSQGDSFHSQKPFYISNPGVGLMFKHKVLLPDLDPTLSGDCEIPWVPLPTTQETELQVADITLEDFFRFVEQDPNFPIEPLPKEPSFELPRGHGINDSYATYISEVSRDLDMRETIIEEILDSYGSEPRKDIWWTSLTQENTPVFGNSEFTHQQICSGITSPSQQNFGISPQDLIQNGCRSDADTVPLSQSIIDIESPALGRTCSLENSHEEDQQANSCLSPDENKPVIWVPNMAKTTSHSFLPSEQPMGGAFDPQSNSLYDINAKLRKKRDELAAAQNTVSKLLAEIKLLEASAKQESRNFEETSFEDTLKPNNSHKRGNGEALRSGKRLKERATTTIDPLPPTNSTTRGRAQHSFNENTKKTASRYAARATINTPRAPKPWLTEAVQGFEHPLSRTLNDAHPLIALHAERSTAVRSLSMQALWSDLLDESTNALSSHSGHTSLDMGLFNCRASSINNLEESIAWLT